jgi:hypothetical protein
MTQCYAQAYDDLVGSDVTTCWVWMPGSSYQTVLLLSSHASAVAGVVHVASVCDRRASVSEPKVATSRFSRFL